ncbi:MAG: putative lipid II flippase FtsW [Chitinispirillales bacterium]|jgi:cell division protein FtsW|nr:putative lipid II flippase FtsW [Chitinispirillales bacterium]
MSTVNAMTDLTIKGIKMESGKTERGKMDLGLFIAVLVLLGFGIILVYSSSFAVAQRNFGGADYFLSRQAVRAVLAFAAFMVFINVDYRFWSRWSGVIYIAAIMLLISVLFLPDDHAVKGAKRWMTLFGVRFQVSDFARMALILMLAKKCGEPGADFGNWRSLIPHYLRIGIICGLVLLEPDYSTTMILLAIAFSMLYMAGAKKTHILATVASVIPVGIILVLIAPYRMNRIAGFLSVGEQSGRHGYQAFQSLVGLGRGGLFGTGLGKGEQKYFYLPEPHTDFILSILGEEFGFVGLMAVFMIFAFIVYKGFKISLNAPDRTGQVMAFGFTMVIAVYTLIHSAVATNLAPTTGIPLPFLSYGGVSLVFTMSSMGILLNISSQIKPENTRRIPEANRKKRKVRA